MRAKLVWITLKRLARWPWRRLTCAIRGHRMEGEDFATGERCCLWCGWNTQDAFRRELERQRQLQQEGATR